MVTIISNNGLTIKYKPDRIISKQYSEALMEYKALTKKEKLTLLSIVFDLNKLGEKVSATLNPFDWINITIGTTDDLKVMTVGGAYGLSFDEAIKALNKLINHQIQVLHEK